MQTADSHSPKQARTTHKSSAADPLWYKRAVIYELPVKAFFDANADGIGDFPGVLEKLDYLERLGVTCLWLLPFFPSPLRDDGYDISDYCNVHPGYGTLDEFERFLDAAHERRMQIVIELVLNHTSDQHPWFQRARHAPPGSVERDYYVWSDADDKYGGVRIIFPDTDAHNAAKAAERVREAVASQELEMPDGTVLPRVTISMGVTELGKGQSVPDFLKTADLAMYRAKQSGRNRVAIGVGSDLAGT